MILSKLIPSASLALALIGGTLAFAPSSVEAKGKGKHISYEALKKNRVPGKGKVGKPANPYTRGCGKATRCKRG
jgi:hypothetical protein